MNTNNVTDMSSMFKGCKSLSSLPDISKWNTKNLKEYEGMFNGCYKLSTIPSKYQEQCYILNLLGITREYLHS